MLFSVLALIAVFISGISSVGILKAWRGKHQISTKSSIFFNQPLSLLGLVLFLLLPVSVITPFEPKHFTPNPNNSSRQRLSAPTTIQRTWD